MQSEAVKKYPKTIYEIQQRGGRVKTTALAQTLGVTAGSDTDAIVEYLKIGRRNKCHG